MHLVATPIAGVAGPDGTLAILHDAGYIDAQVMSLWRRALAGVVAQTLMIVCATLLILRWTLRNPLRRLEKWLSDLRRGAVSEVPDLAGEAAFEPLKREARRLATTLTAARAAAEEEARLRDPGESLWTPERLRAFVQSRLQGSRLFVISNREPYEHVRRGADDRVFGSGQRPGHRARADSPRLGRNLDRPRNRQCRPETVDRYDQSAYRPNTRNTLCGASG